jgi:hypothetical protein
MRIVSKIAAAPVIACLLMGCGPSDEDPEFEFGADEMKNAVTGDWVGSFKPEGATATDLTVHLDYAPPTAQPACGNRELSHPLCLDISTIKLTGTLTTADAKYSNAAVTGYFTVDGTKLTNGTLEMKLPDGTNMNASYHDGIFDQGSFYKDVEAGPGTFTLERP